jgi:hypothetical protein
MGENRSAYRVLTEKSEGKRPLGRPRHRWNDNIIMNLKKQDVRVWTEFIWVSAQTLVNMVKNLQVSLNAGNFLIG